MGLDGVGLTIHTTIPFVINPALPCPALPCPALPCPALPCPALPCPALSYPVLPCAALAVLFSPALPQRDVIQWLTMVIFVVESKVLIDYITLSDYDIVYQVGGRRGGGGKDT